MRIAVTMGCALACYLLAFLFTFRFYYVAPDRVIKAARAQIKTFMAALDLYKTDTGHFPTTEQGLQALRTAPPGVGSWKGPYLAGEIPNDPWRHSYVYHYPSNHGDEPEIISYGADGQPGGDGINADIVNWKAQ